MVKAWRKSLKLDFKTAPHCDSTSYTEHHTKNYPLLSSLSQERNRPNQPEGKLRPVANLGCVFR